MNNKNIEDITDIDNFNLYKELFQKEFRRGPSLYFHTRTINEHRKGKDYIELISNDSFLELIYATLVSWDMDSRRAEMVNFDEFKESVLGCSIVLEELSKFKLNQINNKNLSYIPKKVLDVFNKISITKSKSYLVGNSKVLHHLLPNLVMPMDSSYTMEFFYGTTSVSNKRFKEVFEQSIHICSKLNLKESDFKKWKDWNSSIPKIIDNVIIAHQKVKKGKWKL